MGILYGIIGFGAGFKGFMMRFCVNKATHASEAVKKMEIQRGNSRLSRLSDGLGNWILAAETFHAKYECWKEPGASIISHAKTRPYMCMKSYECKTPYEGSFSLPLFTRPQILYEARKARRSGARSQRALTAI